MAEPKEGDKICDRCQAFKAQAQEYKRGDTVAAKMDLCPRCTAIVDRAIWRAAGMTPPKA